MTEKQTQCTLPADQLNNPSQKNKISKIEKLKESNKLNKKIIIAKTLEVFSLKAIYDTILYTHYFTQKP